eukprot:TRINITY_DN5225_c0_g2_i1.p1 TRINITY_DN5225_c0_g2~~TRINITY_DN5225_c0_g2_i1.p1  ORF type:complete len:420 (+),score=54.53 TRINITY_DN5225_c0_g2_i1:3-1262(+)
MKTIVWLSAEVKRMRCNHTIVFILLIGFVLAQDTNSNDTFTCSSATDCHDWGQCVDGKCSCYTMIEGVDCSVRWVNKYPTWVPFFWFYTAIPVGLNLIVLALCVNELRTLLFSAYISKRLRKSMVTYALLLLSAGSILRIIYFLTDPHWVRGVVNPFANPIVFNIPILLWFDSGMLVFLYWIELQGKTKSLENLPSVRRYRPLLIVFMIMSAVVLFPLGVWNVTVGGIVSDICYNGAVIIMIMTVVVLCLHSGRKLLVSISKLMKTNKAPHFVLFLRKITYFIISLMVVLMLIIITLIIFTMIGYDNPWIYIGFHLFLKLLEFWMTMTMVVFLIKKRPKSEMSGDSGKATSGQDRSQESINFPQNDSDARSQMMSLSARGSTLNLLSTQSGSDESTPPQSNVPTIVATETEITISTNQQ